MWTLKHDISSPKFYNSSSIHNSKEKLLCTSRTSTTTSIFASILSMTNDICVNYSIAPQAYNVLNTHDHQISGCKILSRLIHSHVPNVGGIDGDVQYYLTTLSFNNREQHEDFHSRIIRIQQEIILSGETVSPTRLLFQNMKEF